MKINVLYPFEKYTVFPSPENKTTISMDFHQVSNKIFPRYQARYLTNTWGGNEVSMVDITNSYTLACTNQTAAD